MKSNDFYIVNENMETRLGDLKKKQSNLDLAFVYKDIINEIYLGKGYMRK